MPLAEAIDALLAARRTTLEDPAERRRLASALIRAACETEQAMASPRLHPRRAGRGLLLALTPELADYAERLGRVADEIAAEDPLPSSLRVFQRLYEVAPARRPARLSAPEQRPPPPPGRRRQHDGAPSRPGRNSTRGT